MKMFCIYVIPLLWTIKSHNILLFLFVTNITIICLRKAGAKPQSCPQGLELYGPIGPLNSSGRFLGVIQQCRRTIRFVWALWRAQNKQSYVVVLLPCTTAQHSKTHHSSIGLRGRGVSCISKHNCGLI